MKKLISLFLSMAIILCLLPSGVVFADDEDVTIYVNYQGNTYSIESEPTSKVKDLKEALKEETQIEVNNQKVVYAGNELSDDEILQECSIDGVLNLYYYEESTITPDSQLPYKITSGGTYTIKAGLYYAYEAIEDGGDWKEKPIIEIDTSEAVNLNVVGDIEVLVLCGFIKVNNNATLNINASNYSIKTYSFFRINDEKNLTVNFNGGNYEGFFNGGENATLKFKDCNFTGETELIDAYQIEFDSCNHYVEADTTLDSEYEDNINVNVRNGGNLKFIGNSYFISLYRILLNNNATITVDDSFVNKNDKLLSVELTSGLKEEEKRQITKDTSKNMIDDINTVYGYRRLYKDGNLFYWNHTHKYNTLEVRGNELIGTCTDPGCGEKGVAADIRASDVVYTGEAYYYAFYRPRADGIEFDETKGFIYNTATGEAPVDAGEYTVTAYFAYNNKTYSISKAFTISKATPTVEVTANSLTYNGSKQELVKGSTGGGILLYQVNDGEWSKEIPTAKDPGKYTVKYKVEGNNNYESVSEQSIEVTVDGITTKVDETEIKEQLKEATIKDSNGNEVNIDSSTKIELDSSYKEESTLEVKKETIVEKTIEKVNEEIAKESKIVNSNNVDIIPLNITLTAKTGGTETTITDLGNTYITVTLCLDDNTLGTLKNKNVKVARIHENSDGTYTTDILDANINETNGTLSFKTNKFSTYVIVACSVEDKKEDVKPTPSPDTSSDRGSNLTCEESMGSLNWTWSESKKACVYRVSNTSVK